MIKNSNVHYVNTGVNFGGVEEVTLKTSKDRKLVEEFLLDQEVALIERFDDSRVASKDSEFYLGAILDISAPAEEAGHNNMSYFNF